ncbi:uncharacterized protein ARMOST_07261 [Armillaria ostoyae]|uniref:Uncharacterized protein n=2 Tax=Armillaria TaxID=47424 RepID=A0A284R5A9_ARMOS|nr:hypothetical protein EV421DRAFT_228346 [Armillaria borealis]SJL03904.1 uncharacterized protein ARMOST_07261 [Armillaria ostoyae]
MLTAIRRVRLAESLNNPLTLKAFTIPLRKITTASFTDVSTYKNNPQTGADVINDVVDFAAVSGVDAAGADSAKIFGGRHTSSTNFSHVTAAFFNSTGQQLYFYRPKDGTFWDRFHVPESRTISDWPTKSEFVPISANDFKKKIKPV